MRRSGKSKAEVESSTGSTIGVYDATFEVYPGEIFVIIGLSGSGKSTLLRLLNRLIEPTEGEVYLDGEYISRMPMKQIREIRRRKMGMVFQHFGLLPNRTVLQNIVFGLEVQGTPTAERNRKGEEAVEMVGLHGQSDKQITELSGGMQQRVGLARALATEQEILLMDEPFSALDPLIRRDMQNLFLDIQGEIQRTVVFITHDLDEALMLGHRVAIMKDGEIVQIGTPEDILTDPADEYVQRFIEDVDYTKVRLVETVMVEPKEIAYDGEGPRVVLRRMKRAGLSTIFVVDKDRHLVGLAEVEEVARLAEREEQSLGEAIDASVTSVKCGTSLRKILPMFAESNAPVAVTNEENRLEGVVVRGSLIAGLSAGMELSEEEPGVEGEPSLEAGREEVR
ncbi:MAG: betaine/proline/choline family ABC transporter ATP-binding protein [Rubrobacter sp.]|nr:betaine/proline/choline family ABC transporter ATP-binding protein [Rubrobacter sp.]